MVISRQEAGKNMKILFRQHRAEAEEIRAGGAVTRAVKGGKFIDVTSIVNDFRRAVPQAEVRGHDGEGELRDADNTVSPVNVRLHLAESFFYFGGAGLPFHPEIEIINKQDDGGVARRGKQPGILPSAQPNVELKGSGNPEVMENARGEIIPPAAKEPASPPR